MDYLKALRDDSDLAEEFDSLFDFFLLDELSPRDEPDGLPHLRCCNSRWSHLPTGGILRRSHLLQKPYRAV